MFTGIIEATGKVKKSAPQNGGRRVEIEKPKGWKLVKGQSVSVDGICSTVTAIGKDRFAVDYIPETLTKTTAAAFVKGTRRNLERSLTLQKFIDGHLVQGHVDARAKVREVKEDGMKYELSVEIPEQLRKYVAAIGSISINGVSLTVARMKGDVATVALIPHTLTHTNLGSLRKGDSVNIEVDLIARYLDARHA